MSWGLALSGLLYPTVGMALFVAWGFASKWAERGQKGKALAMRAFVILIACWPLAWSLHLIYADHGWHALGGACVAAGFAVCLYLLAFRLRGYLYRRSVGGRSEGILH